MTPSLAFLIYPWWTNQLQAYLTTPINDASLASRDHEEGALVKVSVGAAGWVEMWVWRLERWCQFVDWQMTTRRHRDCTCTATTSSTTPTCDGHTNTHKHTHSPNKLNIKKRNSRIYKLHKGNKMTKKSPTIIFRPQFHFVWISFCFVKEWTMQAPELIETFIRTVFYRFSDIKSTWFCLVEVILC